MGKNNTFFAIFAVAILIIAALGAAVAIASTNSNNSPIPGPKPGPEPGPEPEPEPGETIEECIAIALASYEEARANYETALENYNKMGATDSKKYCGTSVGAASIQMYASIKSTIKVFDSVAELMAGTTKEKATLSPAFISFINSVGETNTQFIEAIKTGKITEEAAKDLDQYMGNILSEADKLKEVTAAFDENTDLQNNMFAAYSKELTSINGIFKQIENEIDQSKKAVASEDFGTVVSINEKIDEQIKESMEIAKKMSDIPVQFLDTYSDTLYGNAYKVFQSVTINCENMKVILQKYKCTEEVKQIFADVMEKSTAIPATMDTVRKLEGSNMGEIKKSADSIGTHITVTLKVVSLSESVNEGMTKAHDNISEPIVVIEAKLADLKKISDSAEQAYEAATKATTVEEAKEAAEKAYELAAESDEMTEGVEQGLEELQSLVDGVNAELVKASATIEEMEKLTEEE